MSQRKIFIFWLPLFASWLLMTAEGPIISAAINRLPNEVIMLAAQGIVISLSVIIESPIINLLATGTALVRDRQSFMQVRRFAIHWAILLTIVTVLIAFVPAIFDLVVRQWLNTPAEIAEWVRPGMQIMTFWSAAIAWRRFLQGVLIRFNQTRQVAWGTAVRLVMSGGFAVAMALWGGIPGVYIGAVSLMAGVVAEAIYATIAVRPLLQNELSEHAPASKAEPLTYWALLRFHLPLAGTSVLSLWAQPLVIASLAQLQNPTESLAAWPLVFQLLLMMRAAAFALPEVVIALSDEADNFAPLRRFSMILTSISLVVIVLFAFTPLSGWYLYGVQDATQGVGEIAVSGLVAFLLLPAFTTLISWLRGLLINKKATQSITVGMVLNIIVTLVLLRVGVSMNAPGIPTAAVALTGALFVEGIYLWLRTQNRLHHSLWAMPVTG
jgi:hypothetical protein